MPSDGLWLARRPLRQVLCSRRNSSSTQLMASRLTRCQLQIPFRYGCPRSGILFLRVGRARVVCDRHRMLLASAVSLCAVKPEIRIGA